MTPATRLSTALDALNWSGRSLALLLGKNERTVRRWVSGDCDVPADVLAWVERLADFHRVNPPPTACVARVG